jgi:hypothetical protein
MGVKHQLREFASCGEAIPTEACDQSGSGIPRDGEAVAFQGVIDNRSKIPTRIPIAGQGERFL